MQLRCVKAKSVICHFDGNLREFCKNQLIFARSLIRDEGTDVYKRHVFPRPASGLLDTALNEVVIASLRLDDMEVVFTPACVRCV